MVAAAAMQARLGASGWFAGLGLTLMSLSRAWLAASANSGRKERLARLPACWGADDTENASMAANWAAKSVERPPVAAA
jgi:hypothetical protein